MDRGRCGRRPIPNDNTIFFIHEKFFICLFWKWSNDRIAPQRHGCADEETESMWNGCGFMIWCEDKYMKMNRGDALSGICLFVSTLLLIEKFQSFLYSTFRVSMQIVQSGLHVAHEARDRWSTIRQKVEWTDDAEFDDSQRDVQREIHWIRPDIGVVTLAESFDLLAQKNVICCLLPTTNSRSATSKQFHDWWPFRNFQTRLISRIVDVAIYKQTFPYGSDLKPRNYSKHLFLVS